MNVFHRLQKDKQRKQRRSLKLGKKRRNSSKRNYYIISPRVRIKAIIIIHNNNWFISFLYTSARETVELACIYAWETESNVSAHVCVCMKETVRTQERRPPWPPTTPRSLCERMRNSCESQATRILFLWPLCSTTRIFSWIHRCIPYIRVNWLTLLLLLCMK